MDGLCSRVKSRAFPEILYNGIPFEMHSIKGRADPEGY